MAVRKKTWVECDVCGKEIGYGQKVTHVSAKSCEVGVDGIVASGACSEPAKELCEECAKNWLGLADAKAADPIRLPAGAGAEKFTDFLNEALAGAECLERTGGTETVYAVPENEDGDERLYSLDSKKYTETIWRHPESGSRFVVLATKIGGDKEYDGE